VEFTTGGFMSAQPATNITPLKKVEDLPVEWLSSQNFFDMPEPQFKQLLERRAKNRLTFLSIVKNALTEGVDYCNLPVKGKKALPTLLKGGGEVVCQILALTPRITIAESNEQSLTMCCELLNEHQQIISVGYGSRTYDLDAKSGGRNKTTKMTTKSAYLDAVIRAGALSSLFTMDLEDMTPVEVITSTQHELLIKQLDTCQVDTQRFTNWVNKVCESKQLSPLSDLTQMPASLFSGCMAKIESFAPAK
jgi:hypothetical protein